MQLHHKVLSMENTAQPLKRQCTDDWHHYIIKVLCGAKWILEEAVLKKYDT